MSSHRTPTRRRRTGRGRAVLSLGAIGFLALGFGAQGTFAFWTDDASLTTGTFSSGTLDITLNGQLAGAANNGGSTSLPSFALTNLVPGESQAVSFPVANNGNVGLTYTISGTATGALAPGMQFTVSTGTATNNGTAANGNRAGTCQNANLATNQTLTATASTLVATARPLTVGASENICVIAKLDPNADNSLQNKTMTANLTFNAKQVGAP